MAQEKVGFEAFADSQIKPSSFEDFANSQVQTDEEKPPWYDKYLSLVKPLVGGFYGSAGNTFAAMDKAADFISRQTGLDKGGIFENLSKEYKSKEEKLRASGMQGVPGDVAAGIGGAAWDVPTIAGFGAYGLPIHGGLMGAAEGGVEGALTGAIQGALVHKTLQGIALLPSKIQPAAFTGFGMATTPGGIEERVTGGLTWAALGISGRKGKVTFDDFISNYPKIKSKLTENRAKFVIKQLAKDVSAKDIEEAGGAKAVLEEAFKEIKQPRIGAEGSFEEFATVELKAQRDRLGEDLTSPVKEKPGVVEKKVDKYVDTALELSKREPKIAAKDYPEPPPPPQKELPFKESKLVTDNPGGDWLKYEKEDAAIAREKGGYGGKITGYFEDASGKRTVTLPTKEVAKLEGLLGEHERIGPSDATVSELAKSMKKEGYKEGRAVFVNVEYDGLARINEGNHRVRAALEAGIEKIPVEIRYYAGGELAPGKMSPDIVMELAKKKPAIKEPPAPKKKLPLKYEDQLRPEEFDLDWNKGELKKTPTKEDVLSDKNIREVHAGLPITKEVKGGAKRMAQKMVDLVQVEPQFKRIGAPQTGIAIKAFASRQNMELEKAEKLIKGLNKRKLNKWDYKEATFAAASKKKLDSYDPKYRAKMEPVVKEIEAYWKDWDTRLKKGKVYEMGFPDNMVFELEESRRHANSALKEKNIGKERIAALRKEIKEINTSILTIKKSGIKYVHIPKTWLEGLWAKDPVNTRRVMTEFFKDRKTIDMEELGKYLVDEGLIHESELDIRRIMAAYSHQAGRKLAIADIFRTAEREKLISAEKSADSHWVQLNSRTYPSLKGKLVHPVLAEFMETNFTNTGSVPGKFKRSMREVLGATKMLQFYNPAFLPMYDVAQAWWTGSVRSLKTPSNVREAFRSMTKKDQHYWDMHYWGGFSTPFKPGFEKHMKRIKEVVDGNTFLGSVKKYVNPYRLSWKAAWTGDHFIRMITYHHYLKQGFIPREAAQLAAKAHGDYASIPPKTRRTLNQIMFTPSFKIAMTAAQVDMINSVGKFAYKGGKIDKSKKAMAKMAIGLASGIAMREWIFNQILGFKTDKFGLKYTKTVMTDEGEKELVLHTASPDNVILRLWHRFHPRNMATEPDKFNALVSRAKWEAHPLYQWAYELLSNKSVTYEPIYNKFDDPDKITRDIFSYSIKRILRITEMVPGVSESQKRLAATKAFMKDSGNIALVLNWFVLPYMRNPKDQRTRYKAQAIIREFSRMNNEKPPKTDAEAERRAERLNKTLIKLQKELDEIK